MAARRRTEAEWRELVDGLLSSGLSRRDYARRVGVHAGTLGWWRWRLRGIAHARPAASLRPAFAEVALVPEPPESIPDFVVELGSDLRVRVPSGFDGSELRRLVAALC